MMFRTMFVSLTICSLLIANCAVAASTKKVGTKTPETAENNQTPPSPVLTEKDIVNIFKNKVSKVSEIIGKRTKHVVYDVEFDVKKTDSLLAPISGEIAFTAVLKDKTGKPMIDNIFAIRPVIVKLYWSDEQKLWIVNNILTRRLVGTRGAVGAWTNPEKDSAMQFYDGSGFELDDVLKE
jgi:hypothetical protein